MAGFLGFGNFQKPGKGVKKNEPEKKRFFQFFELFFRKLTKLIQLNLLYLLFCIPNWPCDSGYDENSAVLCRGKAGFYALRFLGGI